VNSSNQLDGDRRIDKLLDEIARLEPVSIDPEAETDLAELVRQNTGAAGNGSNSPKDAPRSRTAHDGAYTAFRYSSLADLAVKITPLVWTRCAVLEYLKRHRSALLAHIATLCTYSTREFMFWTPSPPQPELTTAMGEGGRSRTLLAVIDSTLTPMGAACFGAGWKSHCSIRRNRQAAGCGG